MNAIKPNYIYLLIEREFLDKKENVFKIGRTEQEHNRRMAQYPKGSKLLFQMICENCKTTEQTLINKFKEWRV